MLISDMITEIGYLVDRTDIDARITRYINDSVIDIYNAEEWAFLERSYTVTTVASTQSYNVTSDLAVLLDAVYSSGTNNGHPLRVISPYTGNRDYPADTSEGIPKYAWVRYVNGVLKIFFYPVPDAAYSIDVYYKLGLPNTYLHNLTITDDNSAATNGKAVYLDEDALETGIGKFYFVSPTNTDGVMTVATQDGHYHNLIIYDDDNAASLGKAVYVDDDGATSRKRLLFISPTGSDAVVTLEVSREHNHYLQIVDDDAAASTGTQLYFDEDAAVKGARMLSVNAGNADTTVECIITKDDDAHPFLKTFDGIVFDKALARAQRFCKQWEDAKDSEKRAEKPLQELIDRNNQFLGTSQVVKPRGRSAPMGEYWKFPFI